MVEFVMGELGIYRVNYLEQEIKRETNYVELVSLWRDHPECRIKIESQMAYVLDKEDDYNGLCIWWNLVPAYSVPAQQICVRMSILNSIQLKNIKYYGDLTKRLKKTPTRKQQIEIEVCICELISKLNWFNEDSCARPFFRFYLENPDRLPEFAKEAFIGKLKEIVLG